MGLHLAFLPGILNLLVFRWAKSTDPKVSKGAVGAGATGILWLLAPHLWISVYNDQGLLHPSNDLCQTLFFVWVLIPTFVSWLVIFIIGAGIQSRVSKG